MRRPRGLSLVALALGVAGLVAVLVVTALPDLVPPRLIAPRASGPPPVTPAAPVPTGPSGGVAPAVSPAAPGECVVGEKLVPTCGVLWGVAPAAHTDTPRAVALTEFERVTGRRQDIYHAYHRGDALFPTAEEARIAEEGRLLFLNWKPMNWSWAEIAAGHPEVEAHLDRLARHIRETFPEPFFLTVHHEPENDVRAWRGSGYEATDYAAMFRHVVSGLRARGVDRVVTVIAYLAYVPWNVQPWWEDLYPGDDVVDWIGWDVYAYSDPGFGYGDFTEMVNRRSDAHPQWPGMYEWAAARFADKPFMLAEWGVWHSAERPEHMERFYRTVAAQLPRFPRLKAMVYFDTPADQRGRDSRPTATRAGLEAFRDLGARPPFQVVTEPE